MRFRTSTMLIVLIAATACSSSSPNDNGGSSGPPADTDITIVRGASTAGANAFSPANLTISLASKTKVKWYNNDFTTGGSYGGGTSVLHRLVSNDGTTFTSSNIPGGGTFVTNLSAPGAIAYHCTIHPGMTGTITVNP